MRLSLRILTAIALIPSQLVAQDDPPPDCGLYGYKATIVRVIDGDTVVANIDLGFDVWKHDERLRLAGIEAPKKNTDAGKAASGALRAMIDGQTLYICTEKAKRSDNEVKGKYGRYLATIHHKGQDVNQWLLNEGHAVPWGG